MSAMVMGPATVDLTSGWAKRPAAAAASAGRRQTPSVSRAAVVAAPAVQQTVRQTVRQAPAPTSHLRLTVRGRVVLWLAAVLVALGVTLLGTQAFADGPVSAQEVQRHVVQPGETLWQIAESVATPSQDVRDVVVDLVRLNELPDAGLMAGQVIVVPVS